MEGEQLRALVAVVDGGTFERAAALLHVTPSAVSQRIKALEAGVGTVLVQRSKPVRPTRQGEVLLRTARQVTHLLDEASVLMAGASEPGSQSRVRVPVVANADSLATWLSAAVIDLCRQPSLELVLRRDDEAVTADLLRSGEVMAAVTAEPAPVQGCQVHRLGTMRYRAKASRRFIRTWLPHGPTPEAMRRAPVLHYDEKDVHQYRLLDAVAPGARPPEHFVPDSVQYVAMVRAGVAWGMVPDLQDPQGRLFTLDPTWTEEVQLHWQVWKLGSAALDLVTAAVLRAAGRHLR
ncbi:MAG: LysR family transcriptional regulator ArgP [Intrasporangium sp.]|uniref:LysR family transcriptional regulator ArgP n=1 Tax=Intrasporangium sp. TaxID=1925024 RepID=UPI002649D089|nr:LysR family transcriptional regulator ArgP [Intrasporangium sp.]MDN5797671.1 LysR family transcriptional regulator ArgP [Intrasporangium sp.]